MSRDYDGSMQAGATIGYPAIYLNPWQKQHHELLHELHPDTVDNAAYYGCGPDAEWPLFVANADHLWLFDRLPLLSQGGWNYRPSMGMNEQAEVLQGRLEAGTIKGYRSATCGPEGFFSAEGDHTDDLGFRLLGNMCASQADISKVEAVGPHRMDFHYNWWHPDDTAPSQRVVSFMWCEGKAGHSDLPDRDTLPAMDFLMTRGFNSSPDRVPGLRQLADTMAKGGITFMDTPFSHPRLKLLSKEGFSGWNSQWSMHGPLHVQRASDVTVKC